MPNHTLMEGGKRDVMYNNPLYITKEGDERGNMGDLEVRESSQVAPT